NAYGIGPALAHLLQVRADACLLETLHDVLRQRALAPSWARDVHHRHQRVAHRLRRDVTCSPGIVGMAHARTPPSPAPCGANAIRLPPDRIVRRAASFPAAGDRARLRLRQPPAKSSIEYRERTSLRPKAGANALSAHPPRKS